MPKIRIVAFDYATTLCSTIDKLVVEFEALSEVEQELLANDVIHPIASAIWHSRTILAAVRGKSQEKLLDAPRAFYAEFVRTWSESQEK